MRDLLDIVLLLALPASGKSEVRRYLGSLDPGAVRRDFGLGPTVQLDDFPYVHLMRRIDEVSFAAGLEGLFFEAEDRSFRDPRDWGTLIELLNDDFRRLLSAVEAHPAQATRVDPAQVLGMLARIDEAGARVGIAPRLGVLPSPRLAALEAALRDDVASMQREARRAAGLDDGQSVEGRTVVIEFARGGPETGVRPLDAPFGYQYSLSRLAPEILARASVLYVWVTPEISRQRNRERADPSDPGSILHHGVPEHVMRNDYGCDDMEWMLATGLRPGTVRVVSQDGPSFDVPVGRLDNRLDKTSFVRAPRASWRDADTISLHGALARAFGEIASARRTASSEPA